MSKQDEIEILVKRAIDIGKKIEKVRGLTTNQGGIPHPDFYESNQIKFLVKKHLLIYEKSES
jgi:hypothetical protein